MSWFANFQGGQAGPFDTVEEAKKKVHVTGQVTYTWRDDRKSYKDWAISARGVVTVVFIRLQSTGGVDVLEGVYEEMSPELKVAIQKNKTVPVTRGPKALMAYPLAGWEDPAEANRGWTITGRAETEPKLQNTPPSPFSIFEGMFGPRTTVKAVEEEKPEPVEALKDEKILIDDLKAGDYVEVFRVGHPASSKYETVERVTKTLIITEKGTKWWKKTGKPFGNVHSSYRIKAVKQATAARKIGKRNRATIYRARKRKE